MTSAAAYVPETHALSRLREAAAGCQGCDLYRYATQTVFGEGSKRARMMLVGEQPGDAEDRQGHPFVGPAGKLLRNALRDAGIGEDETYITNAVKHFKFIERGKQRIHQSPKRTEVKACMPWLEAEIDAVEPQLVVALGATAAQALLGPSFRVTADRGHVFPSPLAQRVLATIHPSAILRERDDDARHEQLAAFIADLRVARELIA